MSGPWGLASGGIPQGKQFQTMVGASWPPMSVGKENLAFHHEGGHLQVAGAEPIEAGGSDY